MFSVHGARCIFAGLVANRLKRLQRKACMNTCVASTVALGSLTSGEGTGSAMETTICDTLSKSLDRLLSTRPRQGDNQKRLLLEVAQTLRELEESREVPSGALQSAKVTTSKTHAVTPFTVTTVMSHLKTRMTILEGVTGITITEI